MSQVPDQPILDRRDLEEGNEPLPEMLEDLLRDAVRERATDVHLDPVGEELVVRFRVDGHVREFRRMPYHEFGHRLLNQLKVASAFEVERALYPMENQLSWKPRNEEVDIRVTLMPVGFQEAAHLRILTTPERLRKLEDLGMSEEMLQVVRDRLKMPQGLVLIAGPVGVGKTTTMYSLAASLDLKDTIAVSIENPIEVNVPYLRQMEVDEDHDLTMYNGLKTLLRVDPDVILVGEIRDRQSANTAAQAAMAGRFVLSTLHARDAASAIEAFHYLSVPYYVLGSSLRLVIAQNLVRRLCRGCAKPRRTTDMERRVFETAGMNAPAELYHPAGCEKCRETGYQGQMGIFEVVNVDEEIAEWITEGKHQRKLRKRFRKRGIQSLWGNALQKVADGMTSMEEVFQINQPAGTEGDESEAESDRQ